MKLEYGKRYVTRNGIVTGPIVKNNSNIYPFRCPLSGYDWMENGKSCMGQDSHIDIMREYTEPNTRPAEPEKPEQTMQARVIKMAVMPKGEPIFSEQATNIEIMDEGDGEFIVISQEHNLPDYKGKIAVDPEEWPAIKASIEMMLGYIEEAEKSEKEDEV